MLLDNVKDFTGMFADKKPDLKAIEALKEKIAALLGANANLDEFKA